MKKKISKRLISFVTAFVVALAFMAVWSGAADDIPLMQFRNEKVTGLTVTKEIYRKSSSTVPLRSGAEGDKKYYSDNKLSEDEFRLFLLEGSSGENIAPRSGEVYTRSNKYGYYYCCVGYKGDGLTNGELILRPIDSNGGYEVYYYDVNGERQIYDLPHTSVKSTIEERFREDYHNQTGTISKNFSTGTKGEFYIYDGNDGDQVYFKKLRSNYYYITEDTTVLAAYNERNISEKRTGIYDDEIDALSSGLGLKFNASDANLFEVRNQFDKPNDAFTIKRTVNYFGNLQLFDEEFTFELLVDNASPAGYVYEKYEGDTIIDSGTFPFSDEPAIIKLKSNQHIDIKGIMKNTPIEVREIITDETGKKLNPSFSPVTVLSAEEGGSYTLVSEAPETQKKYVSWEALYENNKVDTANFINVPNVMMVRKNVVNPNAADDITEYDFEFEIKQFDDESSTYKALAENKQLRYYLRDDYGEPYGDPNKDGLPFVTENGKFTLKHGQTAIFVGLNEGEKFQITEKRALKNGSNVSAEFKMDTTVYEKAARGETVKTAYTQSSAGELFTASTTYDPKLGLIVTNTVEDKYGRVDPDTEFDYVLQRYDENSTAEDKFDTVVSDGTIKLNGTAIDDTEPVEFKLKDGEIANITNLPKGTYRVVEIDPNDKENIYHEVEKHMFITDVQVNGGDIKTVNDIKSDGSANDNTTDIVSDQFVLSRTSSANIEFVNKVRELKYYFDIEKITFLDKNIHGDNGDQEQRFIFRVERFDENETSLTAENVIESFYVDLSCDKEMTYAGDSNVTLDGDAYNYNFWHNPDTVSATKSSFKYEGGNVKVQKEYEDDKYQYPSSIWNGRKTVVVTKKGKYRVTEVSSWSGADYDYWNGSNRYKGYNNNNGGTREGYSVIIDVHKVKADEFKDTSANISDATVYRPTASFISSESEYAYLSSQSYAENIIKRK